MNLFRMIILQPHLRHTDSETERTLIFQQALQERGVHPKVSEPLDQPTFPNKSSRQSTWRQNRTNSLSCHVIIALFCLKYINKSYLGYMNDISVHIRILWKNSCDLTSSREHDMFLLYKRSPTNICYFICYNFIEDTKGLYKTVLRRYIVQGKRHSTKSYIVFKLGRTIQFNNLFLERKKPKLTGHRENFPKSDQFLVTKSEWELRFLIESLVFSFF